MAVRRFLGSITAMALVWGVLSAAVAQAATLISVVASGTITDSDGGALNGETITIQQSFVVDPSMVFPDPAYSFATFDKLRVSVTIGSGTDVYDSATSASAFGTYTISALDVPNGVPAVVSGQSMLEIVPGFFLYAAAEIRSNSNAFVPSTDLFQNMAFPPLPSDTTVSLGLTLQDSEGNVLLFLLADQGDAFSVTVREISEVPAPAALGLFAAGLAGLLVIRRRRHSMT
jgi:hypothetical protein